MYCCGHACSPPPVRWSRRRHRRRGRHCHQGHRGPQQHKHEGALAHHCPRTTGLHHGGGAAMRIPPCACAPHPERCQAPCRLNCPRTTNPSGRSPPGLLQLSPGLRARLVPPAKHFGRFTFRSWCVIRASVVHTEQVSGKEPRLSRRSFSGGSGGEPGLGLTAGFRAGGSGAHPILRQAR
jgi:hypothetical protein